MILQPRLIPRHSLRAITGERIVVGPTLGTLLVAEFKYLGPTPSVPRYFEWNKARGQSSKSEARNPKEIRRPKPEGYPFSDQRLRLVAPMGADSLKGMDEDGLVAVSKRGTARISDFRPFFRISGFGPLIFLMTHSTQQSEETR